MTDKEIIASLKRKVSALKGQNTRIRRLRNTDIDLGEIERLRRENYDLRSKLGITRIELQNLKRLCKIN